MQGAVLGTNWAESLVANGLGAHQLTASASTRCTPAAEHKAGRSLAPVAPRRRRAGRAGNQTRGRGGDCGSPPASLLAARPSSAAVALSPSRLVGPRSPAILSGAHPEGTPLARPLGKCARSGPAGGSRGKVGDVARL